MDKKAPRKSASKWEQSGERALTEIWREKMVQLRGNRKNSHVHMEMASELQTQGYNYTVDELKTKMHNMTNRYRKEKLKIGTTGGSPSEWDLFHEMENLLAPWKSYNPQGLVSDSINDIFSDPMSLPSPSPSPPSSSSSIITLSPPVASESNSPSALHTSKTKNKNNIEKFMQSMETNLNKMQEEMKTALEKIVIIENEKKDALKSFVDKEAKIQEAILEFLKNS